MTTSTATPNAAPNTDPWIQRSSLQAAQRFYEFLDTGDTSALRETIAPSFVDHTLPAIRPQGPKGLFMAWHAVRAAIPDLRCEVEELIPAGERVTARLRFRGTFTGVFGGRQGHGQPVEFIALEVLRVRHGRVTDSWHLEDNLTLLRQLELVNAG